MKKVLLILILTACIWGVKAQNSDNGFIFTTVKENPITSIKNQNRSSTCWSFAGAALLESELLRMNKGTYDFAEMFIVHKTMLDRAERQVRLHGEGSFSPGGSTYDVIYCLKNYGIVPQEAMNGIRYGDSLHVHNELDAVAGAYVKAIANGNYNKLSPVWKEGLTSIYNTYLGECPETFTYNGKEYTPKSFAQSLGLNADDYISLTSFTHHPFYTEFPVEVPDNWRFGNSWNLPLDEFTEVIDYAINNGYTVLWASDVSEPGFTRNGIAVMPDLERTDLTGSDMARWTGMSQDQKRVEATSKPSPEKVITQEMRQQAYDNWETTDDHGMLLYGIATDQNGKPYYMVKNSWGTNNQYKGTWYASKSFVQYKTLNIHLHKNAIPKNIAKKIGLK